MPLVPTQNDAVKFTLQCLQDVREHMTQEPTAESSEAHGIEAPATFLSLDTLDSSNRAQVLTYILEQLEVTTSD